MFRTLSMVAVTVALVAALAPSAAEAATRAITSTGGASVPPTALWEGPARAAAEGRLSLDEAVSKVRRRYGDVTILKARTKKRNGGRVHRIKFLTDSGRVRTVQLDAETGEFL